MRKNTITNNHEHKVTYYYFRILLFTYYNILREYTLYIYIYIYYISTIAKKNVVREKIKPVKKKS